MEPTAVTPKHRVVRELDVYFTGLSGSQVCTSLGLALLARLFYSEHR